jgi:hypothetical protein
VGTLYESGQVLLDDPRARLACSGDREADRAVLGFHLDDEAAEHVAAKGLPALAIFRVFRHRGGDVVVDPVVTALVVVVRAATTGDASTDLANPRQRHRISGCSSAQNTSPFPARDRPPAMSANIDGPLWSPIRSSIRWANFGGAVPTHSAVRRKSSAE